MTKTRNQIIFFPPPKSEYFFQQHWELEYFFRKKNLQVKWSFPNLYNNVIIHTIKKNRENSFAYERIYRIFLFML
jgi:hypothetical protein